MFSDISGSQLGMIGGLLGCVLGFAGGLFGTCCSIRNTRGPRERQFMMQASMAAWLAVMLFLALLLGLSSPYRFLLWIPYSIALPLAIRYVNKRQQEIIRTEYC
ncbi:MAG: hypothetical protein KFF50_17095 [Desulfatitalea sp.]|nr:hypothetical protein [Desulfatitalea sp.]